MARRLLSELEKQARRRIKWITAQNAGRVVTKDIYWTVVFLQMYLDRCDELGNESPADGLALALHAPNLSRLIGVGDRPSEYRSQRQKTSYEVLSLAVLASLCRRAGKIEDAKRNYAHAFDVAENESVFVEVHGELLRRYGHLLTCTGDQDAIKVLTRAVELLKSASARHPFFLAEAFNTRGHWFANQGIWKQAGRDFSEAMLSVDTQQQGGKRVFRDAILNMTFTIATNSLDSIEQSRALEFVQKAQKQLSHQRLTHMKCQLLWMEGILTRNLHFGRHAARILARARKGMFQIGEAFDFLLVSFDLAEVLISEGEVKRYKQLRERTPAAFEQIAGEYKEQYLLALTRWQQMPVVEQSVQHIKTQVEALHRFGPQSSTVE